MGVNNDGTLRYDTKIDRSGFKKGLAEIKKDALKDSADVVSGFNKTAKAIALSAASIGAGIVAVGVKYNAQMEQYNAGFTTMLGSVEKAQKLMADLKGFAAKTPFELTDLANASTTLLAFGEDVEQLMPDLKMLGDISLGNSEKFKGLALVFGQVQSQGRLMGQDLLQMINQGFNPLQIISEKTGKSVATLKDEMAKGQITFEMVADAMKTATSEGGQFYNAMATQSKTLTGQWSTLKDNVIALTGEISSDISEELTESVLPKLISKVEELNQMWEDGRLQDYIGNATAALVTFGTAIAALNIILFVNDMAQLTNGVKNYTTATKAGAAAQKLMNAELLKNPYTLALTAVVALTAGVITYVATHKSAGDQIRESIKDISEAHDDAVTSIEKTKNEEIATAEVAKTYRDELFDLERQLSSETLTQEEANAVTEDFKTVASKLEEIIPGITDYLYDETGEINLQKTAIDNLCNAYYDLVVAKAAASAAEEVINQTAADIIAQKKNKAKAEKIKEDSLAKLEGISGEVVYYDDGTVDGFRGDNIIEQWRGARVLDDLSPAIDAIIAADKAIEDLEKEQEANKELLKQTEAEVRKLIEANGDLTKSNEDAGNSGAESADTQTDATKKQTQTIKDEFEKQYKNLKRSLERDEITHADYYKELKKLRDTYFDEGSDEWEKYTEELADFTEDTFDDCLDKLDDFEKESLNKIRELKNEQEALKDKLITDKAPIEYGTIDGESFISLANYDKEITQMQRYGNMLDELFQKRGDIPKSVLDEIKDMDTEQAMRYMSVLLNSSDSQFDAFIQARQKLEEEASKNSTKLVSAEAEEMKRILEEKFGELPEDFFGLGDESAEAFGDAFLMKIESAMQMVRDTIMGEMSEISNAAVFSFAKATGGGAGAIVTNNNYKTSYTFNSSKDTTTAQIAAARNAAALERARGGY